LDLAGFDYVGVADVCGPARWGDEVHVRGGCP
jgi:hypothetical protein